MSVNVISETIQEYAGERYYLCGKYFQRSIERNKAVRLHVVVWTDTNGMAPPKGHHVHHKDENRANNHPDNLELLERGEHMSHHHKGVSKPLSESALKMAAEWHGSPAGLEWHRQHFERNRNIMHKRAEFSCEQCGNAFTTQVTGHNRFCSNSCKSAWRRASGLDAVTAKCACCGAEFTKNKYAKSVTCGRACGGKLRRGPRSRAQ